MTFSHYGTSRASRFAEHGSSAQQLHRPSRIQAFRDSVFKRAPAGMQGDCTFLAWFTEVGRRSLGEIVAKDLSQDWLTELAGMRGFLCEVRYSAAGARKVPFPLRKLSGAEAWPSIQTF